VLLHEFAQHRILHQAMDVAAGEKLVLPTDVLFRDPAQ
jgi:hypothetical protein